MHSHRCSTVAGAGACNGLRPQNGLPVHYLRVRHFLRRCYHVRRCYTLQIQTDRRANLLKKFEGRLPGCSVQIAGSSVCLALKFPLGLPRGHISKLVRYCSGSCRLLIDKGTTSEPLGKRSVVRTWCGWVDG